MTSNKIAIYGSRRQDQYAADLAGLFATFEELGFQVSLHPKLYGYMEEKGIDTHGAVPAPKVPDGTQLVVSIGGDGTFLRAARWVGKREIPIFGVNTGHLGYLAGCAMSEAAEMVREICRGNVVVEKRMLVMVECNALPVGAEPFALNEVALLKDETSSMICVNTHIDGNFLADYRADGLIVSTPTGSTAYNLSAGGPLVDPTLQCMVLSPIAPHTLTVRPLVVGGGSVLEMEVESRAKMFRLSLDDRSYSVPVGTPVKISRAPFSVLLIRKKDVNFATVLRDKLLWSARSGN